MAGGKARSRWNCGGSWVPTGMTDGVTGDSGAHRRMRAAFLAGIVLLPAALAVPPARAQTPSSASELTTLFLRGCLPFAGHPGRLRDWAAEQRLVIVPEPARSSFLNGASGLVFDASTPVGKFVLVSADDGLCACVAGSAQGVPVVMTLEDGMRSAGLRFTLVAARNDSSTPDLHFREYIATADQRVWRVLAAVVRDVAGGRAMLTAGVARVER